MFTQAGIGSKVFDDIGSEG